jgi:hypothetical protein
VKRIFVIGNSHVGSLKQGWDRICQDTDDVELVFFAHRGEKIGALQPRGRSLIAASEDLKSALRFTSGGRDKIDLRDSDLVLLYGMGLKVSHETGCIYSERVQNQALKDQVNRSIAYALLKKIRSISDVPVVVGHDPLPARRYDRPGDSRQYLDRVRAMSDLMFSPLNAVLLNQPMQTVKTGFQTKPKYTSSSSRLAIGRRIDNELHPEKDIRHMNAVFGEMFLAELFEGYFAPDLIGDTERVIV